MSEALYILKKGLTKVFEGLRSTTGIKRTYKKLKTLKIERDVIIGLMPFVRPEHVVAELEQNSNVLSPFPVSRYRLFPFICARIEWIFNILVACVRGSYRGFNEYTM